MDERQNESRHRLLKSQISKTTCSNQVRSFHHWKDFAGVNEGSSFDYNEPRQGTCDDCYFIAALISIAWAKSNILQIFPNYKFYNTTSNPPAWSPSFPIDKQLAVDAQDQLVYARTSTGELWPCLYEKAYAMWKNNALKNNQPNMATICGGGNGLTALREITGKPLGPSKTMPPFIAPNNKTKYPTIAQTIGSPSHTYSVLRKNTDGSYLFYNPCGGQTLNVTPTDLQNNYSAWGYVNTD